jgi:hypothetical protein
MESVRMRRLLAALSLVVLLLSVAVAAWSWQHLTKRVCMTQPCDPVVVSGPGSPLFAAAVAGILVAIALAITARHLSHPRPNRH